MIVKHWKLNLLKNSRRVVLFVTTTDHMVEQDFAADQAQSLIQTARQYHRRGQTVEQDHRDLAIGALMSYAASGIYDLTYEHIETVVAVPEGVPSRYVGGGVLARFVPVWERRMHDDPSQ